MVDRISVVHNGGNLKIVCLELLAYWKKKSSPGDRIGGANQKIPHRNEDGGSRDPPDKDCFPVRISEILSPEERAVAVHNPSKSTVRISHPSSASSSGPGDSAVAEKVDVNPLDACDDINSISLGNLNFSHENLECPETNRHIGVHELQGGTIQSGPGLDAGRKSWSEVVSGRAVGPDPVQGQRFAYSGEIERVAALRSLECASLDGPNPSNGHCIAEVLENVIPKKSGPSLIQESDQGFVGAPRSPMRLGNWGD
ncbi:hypothetical protein V6N11_047910 [Hibiscus sabdariffa]|uniref:Uncharacterized protein n=1 Tax=Hibiscus sabdariffa TaxID=183260 RepID=A0ABR2NXE0_9ROSI